MGTALKSIASIYFSMTDGDRGISKGALMKLE